MGVNNREEEKKKKNKIERLLAPLTSMPKILCHGRFTLFAPKIMAPPRVL